MRTILFLEKVFLGHAVNLLCGVELFNLCMIRDFADAGHAVTVPAHAAWERIIKDHAGRHPVENIALPAHTGTILGEILAIHRLRGRHFDLVVLGNTGNRLIPAIRMLRYMNTYDNIALIAHRAPKRAFLHALRDLPIRVTAVNQQIADDFTHGGIPDVQTQYGIAHPELFFPSPAPHPPAPVNFCVIGRLDRPWKGADTAIAGFRALPATIRQNARLHLIGFETPPALGDSDIITHKWQPYERMGDFLRQMDIMLVPSREGAVMLETFSQAAVQGMLTALPLIVSDLPILTEKITSGGGLVFHNQAELVDAMCRLAADAQSRQTMGAAGRATALAHYVWNTEKFLSTHTGIPNK